jgi:subtilisin family serine protease
VQQGVKVICIAAVTNKDDTVKSAIDAALKADVVVVAGVGNKPDQTTTVAFPANLPGVLAVSGIDQNGKHAKISAIGPETAIAAPAQDITSTGINGQAYRTADGTSDSTAIVAGAAALVRAKYPNLSAPEVIHRLTATATDAGDPGRDDLYGYGILDLVKALTADVPPLGSAKPSATAAPTGTDKASDDSSSLAVPIAVGVAVLGGLIAAAGAVIAVTRRRSGR